MIVKTISCFDIKLKFILFILCFVFTTGKTITYSQTKEDCLACHSDSSLTMDKNGKTIHLFVNDKVLSSSVHNKLICVQCHTGFKPDAIPHKEKITPVDCKSCHKDAEKHHAFHPQLMGVSGTSSRPDISCKNCHGTHDVVSPTSIHSAYHSSKLSESCGKCHTSEKSDFLTSAHNKALLNGVKDAPNCITCHKNQISNKPGSNVLQVKKDQAKLCLSCHLDNPNTQKDVTSTSFIKAYENSVHGIALKNGNAKAANCVDCHTAHKSASPSDPISTVNKLNISATCGKCHVEIAREYNASIHGKSLAKGNLDVPGCTDCHGEHNILKAKDPNSKVNFKNLASQVCSPCHSSVALSAKYGMSADRIQTFKESYHGLAMAGGSTTVANCASCHGVHNILPSSDPASTVNKKNIAKTCGRCHPGANEKFAVGKIHESTSHPQDSLLQLISSSYMILIFLTIGFMSLHNILDFYRKSRVKYLKKRGVIKHEQYGHALYLRMSIWERLQHATLVISFFTLVITGFMLRFPNAFWVIWIRDLYPNVFEVRSVIHRTAAVVMVTASVGHIIYISFTKRGRQLFLDLIPKIQDVKDAIAVFKYNIGISKIKPLLDRFSYVEKAEYWALIWGTAVMTITGSMLWFENTFIGLHTKLGWDIARTIHYFEAWLAFLSIIVWHFYFIMFNPDTFPMNWAWLKGTISEEEMKKEHPLELDRIKEKEKDSKKK